MNTPSTDVLDISEEPPLSPQDEREIMEMITVHATATDDHPVVATSSTLSIAAIDDLGISLHVPLERREVGIDLSEFLSAEKKATRVSLSKVIELKKGMIEREARVTREALQSNPADVDELLRQLLVVKMTTEKISDECYKQLKHLLRGMRNASRFKRPLN